MGSKKKNLLVRIASALVLLPLVLVMLGIGGLPFALLVAAAAAVTVTEILGIVGLSRCHPAALVSMAAAAALVLFAAGGSPDWTTIAAILGLAPFVVFSLLTLRPPASDLRRAAEAAAWATAAVPYAGLLAAVVLLRDLPQGLGWTMLALAMTWGNDTGAYFAGLFFGKRKLYPKVSPNKTWEGFFGGLASSILACVIASFFLPLGLADVLILGGVAGVVGPLGDLSESLIKRAYGVKDSGHIIPGHGGLFDRIDALLFVAPWTLAYLSLFLG